MTPTEAERALAFLRAALWSLKYGLQADAMKYAGQDVAAYAEHIERKVADMLENA